jgi:hypothetical protein
MMTSNDPNHYLFENGIVTLMSGCGRCGDNSGHKTIQLAAATPTTDTISYAGYRFPPDAISYVVWLYYRFPLSLRMVEELLAARGIELTYETVGH